MYLQLYEIPIGYWKLYLIRLVSGPLLWSLFEFPFITLLYQPLFFFFLFGTKSIYYKLREKPKLALEFQKKYHCRTVYYLKPGFNEIYGTCGSLSTDRCDGRLETDSRWPCRSTLSLAWSWPCSDVTNDSAEITLVM